MSKSNTTNRILSFVAILVTLIVVLISSTLISENVNHHCHDKAHCPICSLVDQCECNIRTIGTGLLISVIIAAVIYEVKQISTEYNYQSITTTLVSQKIRLDS